MLKKVRQVSSRMRAANAWAKAYFSLAILSICMRSLASLIFPRTYWPARYVAPTTPAPMAIPFRFRRSQRRVAEIMMIGIYESWPWRYSVKVSAAKDMTAGREECSQELYGERLNTVHKKEIPKTAMGTSFIDHIYQMFGELWRCLG